MKTERPATPPDSPGVYVAVSDGHSQAATFVTLLVALVVRDFKSRYRRSVLGPGWAIIQPVALMVIFLFVRGVLDIPTDGVPPIVFMYSALVPWSFFATALSRSAGSVYGGASILKKSPIRREIFPLAAVAAGLIDLAIASSLLVVMMLWYKLAIGLPILWVPALVVLLILLAMGFGMGIAAIGTFRKDILFGIQYLTQFWLLATPIMYPLGEVPAKWRDLYILNPMVGIIEAFRAVLVHNAQPDLLLLGISVVGIVAVWIVAWPVFRFASAYFADVL